MTSKIALIAAALFAATVATAQAGEGNGNPFPAPAGSGVISTTQTFGFLPENGSNGIVQTQNSAPRGFGPEVTRPVVTAQHVPGQPG